MKLRDLIKLIEQDGWTWKRTTGSHQIYRHPVKAGILVIACHGGKDIPKGTAQSIIKQAGLR